MVTDAHFHRNCHISVTTWSRKLKLVSKYAEQVYINSKRTLFTKMVREKVISKKLVFYFRHGSKPVKIFNLQTYSLK